VLVIIPDGTRSGPIPLCFHVITELLEGVAAKLDFITALGTHMPMDEAWLCRHVGITAEERQTKYAKVGIHNHDWEHDVVSIGTIPAKTIDELSGGIMPAQDVNIQINKHILEYDHVIICGPVFPHEVVGFSGGNKYFFPGIAGPEVINFTHWLAAVMLCRNVIGHKMTPVRRILDQAATFIPLQRWCFSMVVKGHDDLAGLYFGTPEESQAAAADLSAQLNIVYVDKPFKTVLSVMPTLYDDIWTASKGMYKVEPAVADGGTIIIYAPHIDEISYTHGKVLDRIGYHVRDYFLKQWDQFKHEPWGVMAHSTLVKGDGSYENGVETPRLNVVLATRITREHCQRINLGYLDPTSVKMEEWQGREAEGIKLIPRAGEMLHRLASEKP
jgi:nickel-dependent lactate racemase